MANIKRTLNAPRWFLELWHNSIDKQDLFTETHCFPHKRGGDDSGIMAHSYLGLQGNYGICGHEWTKGKKDPAPAAVRCTSL